MATADPHRDRGSDAPLPRSAHRPALDGVRAVAVVAVIAYHLSSHVPGGFLGVDVFFVLSGYLITTLLLAERRTTGRIDLAGFWARRARRLLPAVLLLVAAVAFVTWRHDPAIAFGARRGDMLATLFYYANWHFIAAGESYFAVVIGQSPLTHTWSLAIEEQFYVLWPLALLAIAAVAGGRLRWLVAVAAGGVVASALWMALAYEPSAPTRVYFATGARAHELLVGATLAMLVIGAGGRALRTDRGAGRVLVAAWPLVALALALAFLTTSDQTDLYYRGGSLAFALVVALALWIVEAAPRGGLARLLSLGAVAWVGTISYGLYLWHWPMIQWIGGSDRVADPRLRQVAEVAATLAVATVSYYALERPVRTGAIPWLRLSTRRLAIAAPLAAALVVVIVVRATTVPDSVAAATALQAQLDSSNCPRGSPAPVRDFPWCVRTQRRAAGAPLVATLGDSTAQALVPGVRAYAERHGWGFVEAGKNRCSVLPLVFPSDAADPAAVAFAKSCVPAVRRMIDDVRRAQRPDVWIVSDRWMLLPLVAPDGTVLAPTDARHDGLVLAALRRLLDEITSRGEQVVIVVMPPLGQPAECAGATDRRAACTSTAFSTRDPVTARVRAIVRRSAAASRGAVTAVDIDDVVCPGGTCPATIGGTLVRFDGIHFTDQFSRRVVPLVVARAERAGIRFARRP